jgi:hypothetical protein
MKMQVNIETDDIIRQALAEDYERLTSDIDNLKSRKKPLSDANKQDLKDNKKWRKAIKTLIYYYYSSIEADELMKGFKSAK